jgi:hypothetical protein
MSTPTLRRANFEKVNPYFRASDQILSLKDPAGAGGLGVVSKIARALMAGGALQEGEKELASNERSRSKAFQNLASALQNDPQEATQIALADPNLEQFGLQLITSDLAHKRAKDLARLKPKKLMQIDRGEIIEIVDANNPSIVIKRYKKGTPAVQKLMKKGLATIPAIPSQELPVTPGGFPVATQPQVRTEPQREEATESQPQGKKTTGPQGLVFQEIKLTPKQQAAQINTTAAPMFSALDAAKNIRELITNNPLNQPTTGYKSVATSWNENFRAGQIKIYVKQMQSPVVKQAMLSLKQASATGATGFGQLNQKELQILINDLGTLDARNTNDKILLETLTRIEKAFGGVITGLKKGTSEDIIRDSGFYSDFYPEKANKLGTGETNNQDPAGIGTQNNDPLGLGL